MSNEDCRTSEGEAATRREIAWPVILALCLAAFVGVTNVMAPAPFIDDLADGLDTSVPLAGQAVSVGLLMAGFAGLVAGPLADHRGHRGVLLAGVACAGLSAFGTALAPDYITFMATRAVGGFGSSMTIGVSFGAAAALYSGPARRRAMSLIGAALSLSTALGPPALTSLSATTSWRGAFALIGALAVAGFIATLLLFPAEAPHGNGSFRPGRLFESYLPLLGDRASILLYSVWTLRSVCWLGALSFLGAFFSEQHDYSTRAVGFVFMLGGIGYLIGTLAAGGRLGGLNLRRLSALSLLAISAGWAALFTLPLAPPLALGLLVLTTAASGVAQVAILTLIADRTPAGPSTTMVLTEVVLSFGAALGGATGGILLGLGGFIALGVGLPLAGLAGALIAARRVRTTPQAMRQPQPT